MSAQLEFLSQRNICICFESLNSFATLCGPIFLASVWTWEHRRRLYDGLVKFVYVSLSFRVFIVVCFCLYYAHFAEGCHDTTIRRFNDSSGADNIHANHIDRDNAKDNNAGNTNSA